MRKFVLKSLIITTQNVKSYCIVVAQINVAYDRQAGP